MGGGIGFSPDPLLAFPSPVLYYTYYWCCNKGKLVLQATVNFSCNLRQSRPRTTAPHIPSAIFSTPPSQVLCNPHSQEDLGSLDSKGLTGVKSFQQTLHNQHLRTPSGSAGNNDL